MFSFSERSLELQARLSQFMDTHIYPNDHTMTLSLRHHE